MTPLTNIDPVRAMGIVMMGVLVGMGVLDFFGIGTANPDVLKYLVMAAIGVTGGHEIIRAREGHKKGRGREAGDAMFNRPPEMEAQINERHQRDKEEDKEGDSETRRGRRRK